MNELETLAFVAVGSSLVMMAAYFVAMAKRLVGIVDIVWALLVGASAVFASSVGEGDRVVRFVVAATATTWSIRLAVHLGERTATDGEDGRYLAMREALGDRRTAYFLFFQAQAASVVLFSVPFVAATANRSPSAPAIAAGVLVAVLAVLGEAKADRDLTRHRNDAHERGTTCRVGLWSLSRHPNYFFEWTHWFAYVAFAYGSDSFPAAWLGPIAMFVFLHRVSGIPWVEARALRTRGDDYARYQREVNAFFPFPRRREVRT